MYLCNFLLLQLSVNTHNTKVQKKNITITKNTLNLQLYYIVKVLDEHHMQTEKVKDHTGFYQ